MASLKTVTDTEPTAAATLTYVEALRDAILEEMTRDERVVLFGLDVDDPKAIQGTTRGLAAQFGPERVFGTPLSEDAMTGVAIGMALAGLRPIHVHIRMDFLLLAMNQLVNMAAKARYMFGGKVAVPMVIRAMIGKSWGQGPQHSQGLYSIFAHVPGLFVVAPTTPSDAKRCLLAAIRMDDPVLLVEHRLLYFETGPVEREPPPYYPGRAQVVTRGKDVTLVGISHMALLCQRAERLLAREGLSADVIDPVWLSPLDYETLAESVARTGRLVVVDNDWVPCGLGSEIVAALMERIGAFQVRRLGYAFAPCPTTPILERAYYPTAESIADAARELIQEGRNSPNHLAAGSCHSDEPESPFKGPF